MEEAEDVGCRFCGASDSPRRWRFSLCSSSSAMDGWVEGGIIYPGKNEGGKSRCRFFGDIGMEELIYG